MCEPVSIGLMAAGQVASAFGGLASAGAQKKAEVDNYKRQLKIRRINWDGQRAAYGTKVAEYETTIAENTLAASRAFADEQTRLNDLFKQADSSALDSFVNLMERRTYAGTGKTARRREARDLAAYGRSQAMAASNLVRAHERYQGRVQGIRDQLRSTNRNAYSQVRFKPQPGLPPVKPNTDMTAANMQFLGGIASAASGAISGFNQLNAPKVLNNVGSTTNTSQPLISPSNVNYFSAQPMSYNFSAPQIFNSAMPTFQLPSGTFGSYNFGTFSSNP